MARRVAPKIGMTYMDANAHRLVSVEQDVLDIKARIEERWPNLRVYFDKENVTEGRPPWIITEVESNRDKESLVCEVEALDERVINRLAESDNQAPGAEDAITRMDRYNASVERERDRQFSEQIGEANERLLHAMRKDGLTSKKVFVGDQIGNRRSRYATTR